MLKQERQAYIFHLVNLHKKVSAVNLNKDLSIKTNTRRSLFVSTIAISVYFGISDNEWM
jgi:DeoR/GlpR family transcriptional regulator of sugar metabolism